MTGTRFALAIRLSLLATIATSFSCGQGTEPRTGLGTRRTEPAAASADSWHATPVEALAIDPVTPSNLYAGTIDGAVFKSTDGSANWTSIRTGDARVAALAIDPVTPS